MEKNLVLISGGGFSTEVNSYIDKFSLDLCTNKGKKNLVFIPTASHDSETYIEKFKYAFKEHNTFSLRKDELMSDELLDQADLIYIGGGQPFYMIETWRKYGFDKKIIELYHQGKVIVGLSAGAMCWFSTIFENGESANGLGLLAGSFCPHYDDISPEQKVYESWALANPQLTHYKLDNNESLHVNNNRIVAKITSLG